MNFRTPPSAIFQAEADQVGDSNDVGRREFWARRESWLDTIWTALHDAIVYGEAAQRHALVSDVGGIRRALDRARAHFQLAKEATKKIEAMDAEANGAGSVVAR